MEWLGAMFKGIGDTFTAGSNVNAAQIGERNLKRQLAFERDALDAGTEQARIAYLLNDQAGDRQMLMIAVGAVILLIIVALIFRKK